MSCLVNQLLILSLQKKLFVILHILANFKGFIRKAKKVSELVNETQSEEEEAAEHTIPIVGSSPVLENSDNSRFVPSPQDW